MKDNPCIRIGHLKIADHLILGIADLHLKRQLRTLACSTLETVAMLTWNQVCDSLSNKDINGAFIPAPMAMDLFAKGLDIRLLMFAHRSGSIILKNKLSGIKTMAEFKHKTVLIPAGLSIQNMLLHRLLTSAGLSMGMKDNSGFDLVPETVPQYLMETMVINDDDHDIAGFVVEEPFGSIAVRKGIADRVCTTQSLWKDHPCCVFVLETSFIESHLDAVQEIITLFAETGQFIQENKTIELLSMVQLFLGRDEHMAPDLLFQTGLSFDQTRLIPDTEALNLIQEYMADPMGVIKSPMDINLLVDSSFILSTLSKEAD